MKPLRVTLIGPYPPPFGGVASHLTSLVPGLKTRGVEDIAIVAFSGTDAVEQIDGATVYRVNTRERARSAIAGRPITSLTDAMNLSSWRLGFTRLVAEVTRARVVDEVVQRHRSSVVSFYQADLSYALAPLRKRWGRKYGVVLTVLGEVFDNAEFLSERRKSLGDLLSCADHLFSSSKHCASSFAKLGLQHTIEPCYYGVELDRFQGVSGDGVRKQYNIPSDAVVAFFMGRFSTEMGGGSVLDVAPDLIAQHPKLYFILAGAKGPLADRAASVAKESRGRVIVTHDVPFKIQPALYAASDIVLTPTRDQHACMGMSIKEGMATGKAVIGTESGGIPEAIVPNVTGLLVPLGNDGAARVEEFKAALSALATDAARCSAMGRAGRKRAEEMFSAERTIDRYHQVLRALALRAEIVPDR